MFTMVLYHSSFWESSNHLGNSVIAIAGIMPEIRSAWCLICLWLNTRFLMRVVVVVWFSLFMVHHMFSTENRSVLVVSQWSTHTHGVFVATLSGVVQNEAMHCPVEITMDLPGRDIALMVACASKIPRKHSASMVLSHTCKLPIPLTLMHPNTITNDGLGTFCW